MWADLERYDEDRAHSGIMDRRIESALGHIADFARGRCYAGVSWGKDSVAVAGLIAQSGLRIPLVWVRVEPRVNPDCILVRDAFLARFPCLDYDEVVVHCEWRDDKWVAPGKGLTSEAGFDEASRRHGARYISGIRSEESRDRQLREAMHGVSTARTCAPITRWLGLDVFAYLHQCELPVHPAYACSMDGQIERERIRVASLDGSRGTGKGRREWEWRYYQAEVRALREPPSR